MKNILVVIIVVIVLGAVGYFMFKVNWNEYSITHGVSQDAINDAKENMVPQNINVELASPGIVKWNENETGMYVLLVRNGDVSQTFTVNVFLEEVAGDLAPFDVNDYKYDAAEWLSYADNINLDSDVIGESQIIIKPKNAETGIYLFRVVVCKGIMKSCDLSSPIIHGTKAFAIQIV